LSKGKIGWLIRIAVTAYQDQRGGLSLAFRPAHYQRDIERAGISAPASSPAWEPPPVPLDQNVETP
jgi:hypothetical protein